MVVQSVGDVGFILVRLLKEAGAAVSFSEVDDEKAGRCAVETGANRVPAEAVFDVDADVLAPCAVGEVLTEEVARRLGAKAIAGAANNQLATDRAGEILQQRGIWYAPDFAANAGAVIVGFESGVGRASTALDAVRRIEQRVERVFDYAVARGVTTTEAAIALARARLSAQ